MTEFIISPNLPGGEVSLAVVDGRISTEVEEKLLKLEISLIKTEKLAEAYDAISYHPDIMMHHLGGREIIVAPNINNKVVYSLENEGFQIIPGKKRVLEKYPFDIPYNAARVGNFLICNEKFTDIILIEKMIKNGVEIINTKQGYSKCSICVVGKNAVITSDSGLYSCLNKYGIDCLLINPGYINLFNMNYGFIGGAAGLISDSEIAFYGNINLHPDHERIHNFVQRNGKKIVNLNENKVNDFGSLIPLKEYSILTK